MRPGPFDSWEVFENSQAAIERLVELTNSELIQENEEELGADRIEDDMRPLIGDKFTAYACLFISLACVGLAFKLHKETTPMRVKQFEDKMYEDPDFLWFTGLFARILATEGKRVDAAARLLKLCRAAYTLGSGSDLAPDPAEPVSEPAPVPAAEEVSYGEASAGESGESEEDSP